MTEPLVWDHLIDAVVGGRQTQRAATPEECAAVAEALGILACHSLVARYAITPRSRGRYRVAGVVEARVEQACIVSLDPVPETVNEPFEVEFRPDAEPTRAAGTEDQIDADAPILDGLDVEPITRGRLDVGRVVYECVATALEPYPRADGAELEAREAGTQDAASSHPFAKLARLKKED